MTDRSAGQIREEIASEREELKDAVDSFRAQAARAARRAPLIAAGVVAGAVVLRVVTGRLVRRLG
jgi:hypothetical protein